MFFCFNDGDVYKFMKFAEMMDLFFVIFFEVDIIKLKF